jgi:hypothetical protein
MVSTNFSAVDLVDTDTGHVNGARGHDAINAAVDIATRPASTRTITHSTAGALTIDANQLLGGHTALVTVGANITGLVMTNMSEGLPFQLILKGNGVTSFTANLSSIKLTSSTTLDSAVAIGPSSYVSVVYLKISDGTLWAPGGLMSYGAVVGGGGSITPIATGLFNYAGTFITSFSLPIPSGVAANDLIEVVCWHQDSGVTGAFTASGYTQKWFNDANNVKTTKLYKIASGSEGGTNLTVTCPGSCRPYAGSQVWRGVNTTTPYDAASSGPVAGSNNPDPPSITPGNTNAMAVVYAGGNKTGGGTCTPPSGYTKTLDQSALDRSGVIAYKALSTTSAEDPGSFTWSLDSSIVYTDVLRKA